MQYPQTAEEIKNFQPQVKRHLDIKNLIDDIKPGMRGAVDFGTARRAKQDDVILGKTGTCSEGRTHLGWFGSFNESGVEKAGSSRASDRRPAVNRPHGVRGCRRRLQTPFGSGFL